MTLSEFKEKTKLDDSFFKDLRDGNFVLVLGAGFSYGVRNTVEQSDIDEINAELLKNGSINQLQFDYCQAIPLGEKFILISNIIFSKKYKDYSLCASEWVDENFKLNNFLDISLFFRKLFTPNKDYIKDKIELLKGIFIPNWHNIFTLNFDTVLEEVINNLKLNNKFTIKAYPDETGLENRTSNTSIGHLHGIITTDNLNKLVFGNEPYTKIRASVQSLYDNLHSDIVNNKKLIIIGTQLNESVIDDKLFHDIANNITIFHFDTTNDDFQGKKVAKGNRNCHLIELKDTTTGEQGTSLFLRFLHENQSKLVNYDINTYLNKIVSNETNSKIDELYVKLFGQEEIEVLKTDAIGIELLGANFSTTYDNFFYSQNKNVAIVKSETDEDDYDEDDEDFEENLLENEKVRQPKVDTILNIEQETQRFIIVGAPGSGKTTTLKKILFQNANKILNETSEIKIPVFITSNEYKSDKNFKKLISEKLNIDSCESLLQTGKLQLLVDGINEIDQNQKKYAYQELTNFINDYPDIAVILTTRKLGFTNEFNIPVFELKELQESEIREFIQKRNPENQESIWGQLEDNKRILELAYNPLYLSMIVIASMGGSIPNNRGSLFDFFVRSLLRREGLGKIEIESIIDILSELAFYLKREGMVSIPKAKAEKIITDRIKNTYNNLSPFELLAKVNDCNLLSITSNTSFIHEAFLDYFCGVKLKINFNELFNSETITIEDLGINDITETLWYEPLVMCGDLFREKEEEKQAQDFFDLLFKGILQKHHTIKKLQELEKNDWNENLDIACKIAYNLKNIFPSIYSNAERYLSNYMTFWLRGYNLSQEIIPLENLFAAISALSSSLLLEKIFFEDNWEDVWLSCPTDYLEVNDENITKNEYVFENNQIPTFSIINNYSDFDVLFKILFDEEKINSIFFKKIKKRVEKTGRLLLNNTAVKNLKKTYFKLKEINLLKFIGGIDGEFFIVNFQKEEWGLQRYVKLLLKIIRNEQVRIELLKIILLLEPTQRVNIILAFLKKKYYDSIFSYLEKNIAELKLEYNDFIQIKQALNRVQFHSIPQNLKTFFFSNIITEIREAFHAKYKIIKFSSMKLTITLELNKVVNFGEIKKNEEIIINNEFYGQIIYAATRLKLIYLSKRTEEEDSKENFIESIENSIKINEKNKINHEFIEYFNTINNEIVQFDDKVDLEKHQVILIIKVREKDLSSISKTGSIKSTLLFSGLDQIHPDRLEKDLYLQNYINQNLDNNSWAISGISRLGLTYLFHNKIPNINYGIILKVYNLALSIYSLLDKSFTRLTISNQEITNYKVNQIVVIEKKGKIGLINQEDIRNSKTGYLLDEIIRIDKDKKEGHIRKRVKIYINEKDFYFHFDDCDFEPKIGDIVSFLPAINIFPKSFGLPKAWDIQKVVSVKKCIISKVDYDGKKNEFYGSAIDEETSNEIDFMGRRVEGIQNNNIKVGVKFTYQTVFTPTETKKRLIKLLEEVK